MVGEIVAGEGAHLKKFKSNYPVLFDCLYSIFGTMLSKSHLCDQIHGMMRHRLRSQIGMEQADHQRIYNSGENYEMNEEKRNMPLVASVYKKNKRRHLIILTTRTSRYD